MRVIDCGVNRIEMIAMVEEAGTEVLLKSKAHVEISRTAYTFKEVFKSDYKKPGLPYTVKVRMGEGGVSSCPRI